MGRKCQGSSRGGRSRSKNRSEEGVWLERKEKHKEDKNEKKEETRTPTSRDTRMARKEQRRDWRESSAACGQTLRAPRSSNNASAFSGDRLTTVTSASGNLLNNASSNNRDIFPAPRMQTRAFEALLRRSRMAFMIISSTAALDTDTEPFWSRAGDQLRRRRS